MDVSSFGCLCVWFVAVRACLIKKCEQSGLVDLLIAAGTCILCMRVSGNECLTLSMIAYVVKSRKLATFLDLREWGLGETQKFILTSSEILICRKRA